MSTSSDTVDAFRRARAARASGYGLAIGVAERVPPGWAASADLVQGAGLDRAIDSVMGLSERPAEVVRAEWFFEQYAWQIGMLGAAPLVGSGLLPDLRPANTAVLLRNGLASAGAVLSEESRRGDGLDELFGEAIADHLSPLVEAMVARRLRPREALWRAAGDRLAAGLLWCGAAFDRPQEAEAVARTALGPGSPLHVPLEWDLDESGNRFHLRAGCCLAYQTPEGVLCASCPRRRPVRRG